MLKRVIPVTFCVQYSSPVCLLTLASNGEALTDLWIEGQSFSLGDAAEADSLPVFAAVRDWLDAYFQGQPREITFPLSPAGTEFQK